MEKKKLVFAMYCYDNMFEDEIQRIHLCCLKQYMPIFDEVVFWLNVDDRNNTDLIEDVERKIIECSSKKQDIRFHIGDNTLYRECLCFNEEIIKRKNENDLVFFAHNKGTTNVKNLDLDKKQIFHWVIGMYFFSLSNIDQVCDDLFNCKKIFYGSFPVCFSQDAIDKARGFIGFWMNKYNWGFMGTFYWTYTKRLFNYINEKKINEPIMTDRWFAENYPGNITEFNNMIMLGSYNTMYNCNYMNFYTDTETYINSTYDDKICNEYYNFYNKIIEEANK